MSREWKKGHLTISLAEGGKGEDTIRIRVEDEERTIVVDTKIPLSEYARATTSRTVPCEIWVP